MRSHPDGGGLRQAASSFRCGNCQATAAALHLHDDIVSYGPDCARPPGEQEQEATLQALKAHGINLLCQHMSNVGTLGSIHDRAARLGMTFMPSTNSCGWGVKMDDSLKGRLASGAATRLPCLNNPAVRKGAAGVFAEWLRDCKMHPTFSGPVYYGDDFALEMKHKKDGTADLACHCDTCRKDFKEKAGKNIPQTCEARTGVVAPDDLLLQWMRYRCSDLSAGFMDRMRKAKDEVDPAIRIGMIHGWSEQPFVNLAAAIYAPLSHAPCDAVSSYCYPELVSPRMDFIAQYEIARMGHRDKDRAEARGQRPRRSGLRPLASARCRRKRHRPGRCPAERWLTLRWRLRREAEARRR